MFQPLPIASGCKTALIVATAAGLQYCRDDLVHAVLVVEQLLTTGGGWQDQVGGLHPGLTLGSSDQCHNVRVVSTPAQVSPAFIDQLDSRLLLLFTGKPRLAKNLLQNVVRLS